ncbi:hypothetical protein [Georgenia alba]
MKEEDLPMERGAAWGVGIAVGVCVGVAVGAAADNFLLGIPLAAGISVALARIFGPARTRD